HLESKALQPGAFLEQTLARGSRGRDGQMRRAVVSSRLNDFIDGCAGRHRTGRVLTLRDPQFAVAYRQDVGAVVSSAPNDSNVVVPIGEEKSSDVSLECLPRAIQETRMVQEAL